MELIERRIKKVINPHSLVFLIQRDCHLEADFSIDILLFLLRYSSFLTDIPPANNFSKRQIPPPGSISTQNLNGARYLDPKYSRWISVDPALGEYVPLAPVNDEAKKHNQNLPGMGGLFNTVNLSLYHYAGNNPVKYIDPDGRIAWTSSMWWLPAVDGPIPIGDIIYGIGVTVDLIGFGYAASKDSVKTNDIAISRAQTKKEEQNNVFLYRAVDRAELESIKQSGGRFSMGDNNTYEVGKLFQTNNEDAYSYAILANKSIAKDSPYVAIVSTTAPKAAYTKLNSIIDAPSSVIVPKENLKLLTPAIIFLLEF